MTEGAELELDPNVKIAPYMDIETGLYGFIDVTGQVIIEPKFQYAESFSEGVAVIAESGSKGTYYGYIDRKGDVVLPLQYEYARGFHEGLALVSSGGDLLVINKRGEVSFKLSENMVAGDFSSGMAPMYPMADREDTTLSSGYMDRNGEIILELPIVKGMPFSEDYAQVFMWHNDVRGWGYVDHEGNMAIEPQFIGSEPFSEGVAAVAIRDEEGNKKWGYIDETGEFVIDPIFDSAFAFSENLAVVYLDDQGYGYIDRSGQIVIGPGFKMATPFSNGYANVRVDSTNFKCINKFGEMQFEVMNKLVFNFN